MILGLCADGISGLSVLFPFSSVSRLQWIGLTSREFNGCCLEVGPPNLLAEENRFTAEDTNGTQSVANTNRTSWMAQHGNPADTFRELWVHKRLSHGRYGRAST